MCLSQQQEVRKPSPSLYQCPSAAVAFPTNKWHHTKRENCKEIRGWYYVTHWNTIKHCHLLLSFWAFFVFTAARWSTVWTDSFCSTWPFRDSISPLPWLLIYASNIPGIQIPIAPGIPYSHSKDTNSSMNCFLVNLFTFQENNHIYGMVCSLPYSPSKNTIKSMVLISDLTFSFSKRHMYFTYISRRHPSLVYLSTFKHTFTPSSWSLVAWRAFQWRHTLSSTLCKF